MVIVYYIGGPNDGKRKDFSSIKSDWQSKCPHTFESNKEGIYVASEPVASRYAAQGYVYTRVDCEDCARKAGMLW